MRHVVLVVMLVGAAFLGGAFINGPGLRWVQTQVLGSLGLGDEEEVASVDLSGGGGAADTAGGSRRSGDEKSQVPMATMPTVVAAGEDPKRGSSRGASARKSSSDPASGRRPALAPASEPASASARGNRPEAEGLARADDGPPPLPADLELDRKPPQAPRDPAVTLAKAAPTPESVAVPAPAGGRAPAASGDGPPSLSDSSGPPSLPDGLRPAAPDSSAGPLSPQPMPMPAPGRAGDENWGTLARKMQVLGISKFTIEGQPGGRVVFACLIPMAGRHAVSQRFEAEGEDAVAAARAALRRVALWRAAQPQDASASPNTGAASGAGSGSNASAGSTSTPASPRSAAVLRPSPR